MGQDFAQFHEWSEEKGLEWELLEQEDHQKMQVYMKALLTLYKEYPALYQLDYSPEGYEWINCIASNENMLIYLRKTEKEDETLLVVCNFSPLVYEDHRVGVPFRGKYKEIFNSDREEFGGAGNVNPRVKTSKKEPCDEREDSISIKVPPMGISIFSCTRVKETASANEKAKARKKETAKKAASKKNVMGKADVSRKKAAPKKSLKEELEQKIAEEEK